MRIACLGWGSLIWDPRLLPIRGQWFCDGPLLPIEFAKKSNDGRVTLVLHEGVAEVRCLWSFMTNTDLDSAKEALALREGSTSKDLTKNIGFWCKNKNSSGVGVDAIKKWAETIGIDAVIWTSLKGNFAEEKDKIGEEVLAHIKTLSHEQFQMSEKYVRMAPKQIDTDVRRLLERELGWWPLT